jgi:hypothetical protein
VSRAIAYSGRLKLCPSVCFFIIPWRIRVGGVKRVAIPRPSLIDDFWAGHPAIGDHLVKFRGANADIGGGLDPAKAARRKILWKASLGFMDLPRVKGAGIGRYEVGQV